MNLREKPTPELINILEKRKVKFSSYRIRLKETVEIDKLQNQKPYIDSYNVEFDKIETTVTELPLVIEGIDVETAEPSEEKAFQRSSISNTDSNKSYSERMRGGVFRRRMR